MRTSALVASIALAAGAAGLLLGRGPSPATAAPGDQRIGVVDIAELLKSAPGKDQIEERYRQRKDATTTWGKAESDRIKGLQSELERTTRVDPARAQKEKDLEHAMLEFKFEGEYRTRQNEVTYTDDMEALYIQIKNAISQVATKNGFSLVVIKNDERVEATRYSDFIGNVALRPVVYWERGLDITQSVKDALGASRVPGTPPPSVPPAVPPAGGTPPTPPPMSDPSMR